MFRRILVLAALAAIVLAGVWALFRPRAPDPIAWQGYAEADFVKVGPTQQGLLTAVHVARGDRVVKGQPLFEQDDADDRAAVDQARRLLQQARDQLANLLSPAKPTEIEQAKANLRDAEAARDRAQEDLQRSSSLVEVGLGDPADRRPGGRRPCARRKPRSQRPQPRSRPLRRRWAGRRRSRRRSRWSIRSRRRSSRRSGGSTSVRSSRPTPGVVADVIAFPGETLAAGAPVVSLLPPQNIFVRFFIPEPELARVHVGDKVAFSCDNCPGDLGGVVSFISPQAEYTPPFIYSEQTRSKFVFLAEARPPPAAGGASQSGPAGDGEARRPSAP